MKIELKNLKKSFGKRTLFSNFNYTFKENKFYAIVGESGTGKTTILNILSLLDDKYDGDYFLNNSSVKNLNTFQKGVLKSNSFGYIFQNFNLLEEDTVFNNVYLSIDSISDETKEEKEKRVDEILTILDVLNLKNEYAKNLSGGEKQRVSIARALINSPEVIFCDEPTGSLDSINTENVFKILKSISIQATIICVTHDKTSVLKYADYILEIKDKTILCSQIESRVDQEELVIKKIIHKKKGASLKLKFIFEHLKNKFKNRKIRNVIKNFLITISLISTGLSIGLTEGLHTSLMSSFKAILNENTVVLNKKDCKNAIFDYYSSSEADIARLINVYKEYLDYYGVNYLVDFENYFIDENSLYLDKAGQLVKIDGFNARVFNEFIFVPELEKIETYPKNLSTLKDDEIVLSINYEQMKKLCMELRILRDFDTLGEYLLNNDLMVTLKVRNNSWYYEDEQLFKVKAFVMDASNRVYHTNNLFNKVLFEDRMRFPVSIRPSKIEKYPWVFKKVFYVHTKKFQSYFLNKVFYDENYYDYVFDNDNKKYSPISCPNSTKSTNRIYVYKVFKDMISLDMIENIKELNFNFKNYYFSTPSGYYNNGTSVFSGFAKPTFFSLDEKLLDEIIDAHSRVKEDELLNIVAPKKVVDGYAFKAKSDSVKFKTTTLELLPNEIIVSKGFAKILGSNELVDKDVFSTMLVESESKNGRIENTFKTIKLKIKDVVENDLSVSIYQNKDFSISLFRDFFKLSSFNLIPTSIIFETENRISEKKLNELNKSFGNYELKNPIIEIEKSIDESTKFLQIILFSFSAVSVISSIILLLIISLINAIESRKEIAVFTILGFSKIQILKIFVCDNFINCVFSFVVSLFTLSSISYIVNSKFVGLFGGINVAIISPLSILFNILAILLISIISSLSTLNEIKNIDLIQNLH